MAAGIDSCMLTVATISFLIFFFNLHYLNWQPRYLIGFAALNTSMLSSNFSVSHSWEWGKCWRSRRWYSLTILITKPSYSNTILWRCKSTVKQDFRSLSLHSCGGFFFFWYIDKWQWYIIVGYRVINFFNYKVPLKKYMKMGLQDIFILLKRNVFLWVHEPNTEQN